MYPSADVRVWSAEKWLGLNLTFLTTCYDHVMFASQQPSDCDFLRGVWLHCRNGYDLHASLKAKGSLNPRPLPDFIFQLGKKIVFFPRLPDKIWEAPGDKTKQKAWVWISAMSLQVVMSISRCTLLHNVWPLVVGFSIAVTLACFPTWTLDASVNLRVACMTARLPSD